MTARALLVDLDGTLADTIAALRGVYFRVLSEHGIVGTDAEFKSLNGPPLVEIARRVCATHALAIDPNLLARQWSAMAKEAARTAPPVAGAREVLMAAAGHGWRTAVVTSGPTAGTREWLDGAGLGRLVDTVIGCENTTHGKPAPDPYLAALAGLGADAAMSVAIEDSLTGARSAIAAGVATFLLTSDPQSPRPAGSLPLATLADAVHVLAHDQLAGQALPPGIQVTLQGQRDPLPARTQLEIDRIWQSETSTQPHLFDGEIVSATRIRAERIEGHVVPYSWLVAQTRQPALRLGICPLAVTGLTSCRDGLLLGRRSASLASSAGLWEFAPAGSVDCSTLTADGRLDLQGQIARELAEEVGIASSRIRAAREIGLVRNATSGLHDVVIHLDIDLPASDIHACHHLRASREYDEIAIVAPGQLAAFCHRIGWRLVDVTALLVRELLARDHFGWRTVAGFDGPMTSAPPGN